MGQDILHAHSIWTSWTWQLERKLWSVFKAQVRVRTPMLVSQSIYLSFCLCCVYRDLGSGFWEMTCTLPIDAKLLKDHAKIPYKYVIFSPKMKVASDCYEFLHAYRELNPNRFLTVASTKNEKDFPGMPQLLCILRWRLLLMSIKIAVNSWVYYFL